MKKIITIITIASVFTLTGSVSSAINMRNMQKRELAIESPNKVELSTSALVKEAAIPAPEVSLMSQMNSEDEVITVETEPVAVAELTTVYYPIKNITMENTFEGVTTKIEIPAGTHLESVQYNEGLHLVNFKGNLGWVDSKVLESGDVWLIEGTIISNKGYNMSSSFNPGINPEAQTGFLNMKRDAKLEGISLNEFSTFRSYQRQTALYGKYVSKHGQAEADTFSARPGHSEHQTGLAFDIGGANSNLWTSTKLGETIEGKWMAQNAHRYGFILRYPEGKEHITGYQYEPWHFRYVGAPLAEKIYESGLTLDEYFDVVSSDYTK